MYFTYKAKMQYVKRDYKITKSNYFEDEYFEASYMIRCFK